MTLSADTRNAAMQEALRLLVRALGEARAYNEVVLEIMRQGVAVSPFTDIAQTMWDDLEERGCIQRVRSIGAEHVTLTAGGWLEGLKVADLYDTPEQRARILTLRRTLVDLNRGRPTGGTRTSTMVIAGLTGLPIAWVTSAVNSQLLCHWHPDKRMELEIGTRGRVVIPARFDADAST